MIMKNNVLNMEGKMNKLLTKLLLIIMIIGTPIVAIFEFLDNDFSRILTFIAIYPLLFVPLILNKLKFKLNDLEIFQFYFFLFLADFLGCVLNLYNTLSWYDLFVHFLSGIFTFIFGVIIFRQINNCKIENKKLKVLFCLGLVALVAVLWEIFEFSVDTIIKTDLQHNQQTGVSDTMGDLIVASFGGIISAVYTFFQRK